MYSTVSVQYILYTVKEVDTVSDLEVWQIQTKQSEERHLFLQLYPVHPALSVYITHTKPLHHNKVLSTLSVLYLEVRKIIYYVHVYIYLC